MFNYDVLHHFRNLMKRQQMDRYRLDEIINPLKDHLDSYFFESHSTEPKSFIFGAHLRGTALYGVSPIDLLYILPFRVRPHITSYVDDVLPWMSDILSQILKPTPWTVELQSKSASYFLRHPSLPIVNLKPVLFHDDLSFITLDGLNDPYRAEFRPFAIEDAYRIENARSRQNLELLSKTVRFWANTNRIAMGGFLIDCLAFNFIRQSTYRQFSPHYQDCLLRDFFRFLSDLPPTQDSWPIADTDEIVFRQAPFCSAAEHAYHLVERMIANSIIRQDDEANHALRLLMGERAIPSPYMAATLVDGI